MGICSTSLCRSRHWFLQKDTVGSHFRQNGGEILHLRNPKMDPQFSLSIVKFLCWSRSNLQVSSSKFVLVFSQGWQKPFFVFKPLSCMVHHCPVLQTDLVIISTQLVFYGVQYRIHRSKQYNMVPQVSCFSPQQRPLGSTLSFTHSYQGLFLRLVPMRQKDFEGWLAKIRYFFSPVLIMRLKQSCIPF